MSWLDDLPPDALVVPAKRGSLVTASASDLTAGPTRGIHANVSETITVMFADATATTDLVVVAGSTYPYCVKRVTVGTGVVALY